MTLVTLTIGLMIPLLFGVYLVALGLQLRPKATSPKLEHFIKVTGSALLVCAGIF